MKLRGSCKCKNIEMGSHKANVTLRIPPHMKDYALARKEAGLNSEYVCVDRCVAREVEELWGMGIVTYGSCCGHNVAEPMVNVDKGSISRMLALGYVCNHPDATRRDTFRLKSVPVVEA